MTPSRRQQTQRKPHQLGPTPLIQALDYESDSAILNEPQTEASPATEPLPPVTRTNTELNLTVIRRYIPNVRSIAYIAASAVIYSFDSTTGGWEKLAIEGTLFITSDHDIDVETGNEVFTIMVLNRRGMNNFTVDIGDLLDVEVTKDLLILGVKGEKEMREVKGIWIHEDKDGIRQTIGNKVKELWDFTAAVRGSTEKGFASQQLTASAPGRQRDLSEMFRELFPLAI